MGGQEPEGFEGAFPLLHDGEMLNGQSEGQFEILEPLGRGRFGMVYRARDTLLGEDLALKIVPVLSGSGELYVRQLMNEFRKRQLVKRWERHVLRVEQPILAAYGERKMVLLPMELADGGSLRMWLCSDHSDQVVRAREGLEYFRQACLGVGAIHLAGWVHMDVKPENLLFCRGVLKVSDFGLSRDVTHLSAEDTTLLQDGVGTPCYMSPEQIIAANPLDVDARSDIYSLGCVLYEILLGRIPFGDIEDEERLLDAKLTGAAARMGDLAPWQRAVVAKCLARDPARRYQTTADLLEDVDAGGSETQSG